MIFSNIELHNVSEIQPLNKFNAYKMLRVPNNIEKKLNDFAQTINSKNCGVELRFVMHSESVIIKMCTNESDCIANQIIYYGNIPAGWQNSNIMVTHDVTEIKIDKPNYKNLELISKQNNYPFDPHVVRVILMSEGCSIIDINGDVEPPQKNQVPQKKLLCYGSSITYGALALIQNNGYVFRTGEKLGYDVFNLGYAGSAYLENIMADYISARNDIDIFVLEMGINMLYSFTCDEFKSRATYFINKIVNSQPMKPVFCIDLFYCESDIYKDGKAELFRNIIREILNNNNYKNAYYINGRDLLTSSKGLSADLVHPTCIGCNEIADNLTDFIKNVINDSL